MPSPCHPTQAVALLDADFCLSAALGQRMRSAAYSAALLSILRQGAAVVLPAFEAANATDPGATALVRHAAVQVGAAGVGMAAGAPRRGCKPQLWPVRTSCRLKPRVLD